MFSRSSSFKIQAHAMFFDGSVNSTSTVMANLHQMFIEAAMKMYRYVRCLAVRKQPKPAMLISESRLVADQTGRVEAAV